MKKHFAVLFIIGLLAGCQQQSTTNPLIVLSRGQIHVGMTDMDVKELYGFKLNDSNSWSLCPEFTIYPITEAQVGDCKHSTYRYWLEENSREVPFLLTFESCRMPNYEAVQKEKGERIDHLKESYTNNPDLKKEVDAFCKEHPLTPENMEIFIELLAANRDQPLLPQCTTDWTLIAIELDKNYNDAKKRGNFNYTSTKSSGSTGLQLNAYGPGVHMNRYGQPVRLRPDFGGVYGEHLQIQPNAYGPGVHMDQYGRPVREYPYP